MNADTETKVDVARSRAEKLISDGAQLLVGAFDSGQTTAIAQVAEQKGIPLVINIAAAPPITEQGYKFVFRNFPTGVMILRDAFLNQKEIFQITGSAPKTAVMLHVNDTYGTSIQKGMAAMFPKFDMPYQNSRRKSPMTPVRAIYRSKSQRPKATGAEALIAVSRLNDAILLTRELVKQRWNPMAVLSHRSGMVRGSVSQDPRQAFGWSDQPGALVRSEQEAQQVLEAALAKAHPGVGMSTNHVYTFEALLVAADAYKRAGSADPKALADAIRTTNITNNVSPGPGIMFDAKGQNDKLKGSAIQNRDGKLVTLAPKEAANAKPEWPLKPYDKRG